MTMRLPPSEDGEWSATLAVNLLENFAGSRINEELRDTSAEFASMFGRRGCTLANVLRAVWRTNDSVNGEFSPFEARPRAHHVEEDFAFLRRGVDAVAFLEE